MMTRRDGVQQKMLCVTLESLMPQEHFLRRLDSLMDFSFIYQRVESLYSHRGRPSIDPVVVVKMLLLGYLYGIDSERRLEQEVRVNIAYRWFLGIDLDEPVPDHSTFSQLRRRKFNGAALFEELFDEVVRKCIEHGLIDGKLLLTDSTHVRANARNDVLERVAVEAEPSAYLQRLNEQAVKDGVYPKHRKEKKKGYKELVKSPADPDAGFMKRTGKPLGFYYLSHQTCDARHGLITDVHTTPGNVLDSTVHSERIKRQIATFGFRPEAVCADSAYDSSEIHKDMLDIGIRTYIPKRNLPKPASGVFSEADFIYDRESNTLTCPNACRLIFSNYRDRPGQKRYKASAGECSACPLRSRCISRDAKYRVVERAYFKWASEEQHMRNDGTPGYYEALRLRKIYCEGNFSHQKAEHNLRRLRKRGLGKAHEHCLLSATALNLKRMVKLLTTRKHPGVSLRKTLSAIGYSMELRPMALLSTGPIQDYLDMEASLEPWQDMCYHMDPAYFIEMLSRRYMRTAIDWESGTCNFDNPEFIAILEAAARVKEDRTAEHESLDSFETAWSRMGRGQLMVSFTSFSDTDLTNGPNFDNYYTGKEVTYFGYPSTDGEDGLFAELDFALGICVNSEHKEAYWDYVRDMLLNSGDPTLPRMGLPLYRPAFEAALASCIGEEITQLHSEEEVEKYRAFIESADSLSLYDGRALAIIMDEANAFLSGAQSAGQAAKLNQERMSIYVAEQS